MFKLAANNKYTHVYAQKKSELVYSFTLKKS